MSPVATTSSRKNHPGSLAPCLSISSIIVTELFNRKSFQLHQTSLMLDVMPTDGFIPFVYPGLSQECHTYYKVFGDLLNSPLTPLLVLHGGPGAGHDYLLGLSELHDRYSIPVIFYDQIGSGRSTHLPETKGDKSLWQEKLFISELDNLISFLKLRDTRGYHILGQSWGGMLGSSFAASQPAGLQRLVLANTPADSDLWTKSIQHLRSLLPAEIQETIHKAEASEDFENPAYLEAVEVFYKKHLCTVEPWPCPEVQAGLKWLESDTTVYSTMHGPSELTSTGSLKGWSVLDRLQNITAPTLVYNGSQDEAGDICVEPFFWGISSSRVKWRTIQGASHFAHVEKKEEVLRLVGEFLTAK